MEEKRKELIDSVSGVAFALMAIAISGIILFVIS